MFWKKRGRQVAVVVTGLQALNRLLEAPYDLVLMDVQMPEMDGLAATAQIRRPEGPLRNIGECHDPAIARSASTPA